MSRDLIDRMQGKENWNRREADSLRKYSKSPSMPELAEMHEETADALKDARLEIERLRADVIAARHEGIELAIAVASKRATSRQNTAAHCQSDRSRKHMHIRADEAGQLVADIRAMLEGEQ